MILAVPALGREGTCRMRASAHDLVGNVADRALSSAVMTPEAVNARPVVLFACVHNSGRSVAAKVLTEHHAHGAVEVRSAGSEPGDAVNPQVAAVLADR